MPTVMTVLGGDFEVWTQGDFKDFVCTCGQKDCHGNAITMEPPCRTTFDAVYAIAEGVLLLTCNCGEQHTRALRISGDIQ